MGYLCCILLITCVIELIAILWMRSQKKSDKNIEDTIKFFRALWGKFTFYVLATSIIGLFLGSIYFKEVIGLDVINNWVSIVLGLVALIIGIISLFLSFYNVDQSAQIQDKNINIMSDLQKSIEHTIDSKIHNLEEKMRQGFKSVRNDIYKNSKVNRNADVKKKNSNWGDLK